MSKPDSSGSTAKRCEPLSRSTDAVGTVPSPGRLLRNPGASRATLDDEAGSPEMLPTDKMQPDSTLQHRRAVRELRPPSRPVNFAMNSFEIEPVVPRPLKHQTPRFTTKVNERPGVLIASAGNETPEPPPTTNFQHEHTPLRDLLQHRRLLRSLHDQDDSGAVRLARWRPARCDGGLGPAPVVRAALRV